MKVVKVTTYFKDLWSVTMLDNAAACPTGKDADFQSHSLTVEKLQLHWLLSYRWREVR